MPKLIFVILFSSLIFAFAQDEFPACSRSDPDISSCIKNSINKLKDRFKTGDLGLGLQIDPLDPFLLKSIAFGSDNSVKVVLENVYIRGATNFDLKDIKYMQIRFASRAFLLIFSLF
jgi:hypothetical protein